MSKAKTKKKKDAKKPISKLTIGLLLSFIILMIVSYFIIGLIFTIFLGIGIGIIVGFARLLDKVRNKPKQKKIVNIIIIILLSLGILCMILAIVFLIFVVIKAPKFDVKQLDTKEQSILYDINGEEFERLGSERREKISYDELPEVFVDALVATEDSRFFQHNGFDAPRFLRASLGQVAGHSDAGGASTISMQVIKNTFTSSEASGIEGIIRKFTDIYLAIFKLEKNYTKEQIIEFYVNNHNLGGNIYGVKQAAKAYFNKDIKDLNLAEATVLAGMFKAPNLYKPTNTENMKAITKRRDTVLYLMRRHGYITEEEEKIASSVPIESLVDYNDGASTGVSKWQAYIDTVADECEDKYGANPYTVPMKVYTNLDRAKQEGVNRVMNGETFQWANDTIQGAATVIDSATGKILAVGGGRNISTARGQSLATSKQVKRQPGSTAKPLFDYGPLIEFGNASTYGYNDNGSYKLFVDEPYSYTGGKSIKNADGKFMGPMSIRKALSLSRNIPALKAFQRNDNKKVVDFVESLGIEPEVENGKIHEAHALGAFTGVNTLQMAGAYAAFSNGGYYNEPYTVSKVVFRDSGEEFKHESEKKQVMSDATAYMITSILDDVTLTGAGNMDRVAMKTGTTNFADETIQKYGLYDAIRDSWVVGFTTKTVIGMWYGYANLTQDLANQGLYCHTMTCSAQKDYLFTALAKEVFETNKEEFKMPNSVVRLPIITGSNPAKVASDGYGGSVTYEYFKKGSEPTNVQSSDKLDTPSGLSATYDKNSNTVNLTWNAVTPKEKEDDYGTFGYNVYFNSTLLGFTEKTSFTVTKPNNPYGTYKVVATFKSYDGMQSSPATFELKKVSTTLSIKQQTISAKAFNTGQIKNYLTVTEDGKDITASTTGWTLSSVTKDGKTYPLNTLLNEDGIYLLKYRFTYDGEEKESGNIRVTITGNSTTKPTNPDDPGGGSGGNGGNTTPSKSTTP